MTVRALNANGGIVTSGRHFINNSEEVAQTIVTRLKLFYGEYFRNIKDGTRWFEDILGKGNTNGKADAEIRRRISQTEGVSGILEYNSEFDFDKRTFNVTCSVLTIYGDITIKESFSG